MTTNNQQRLFDNTVCLAVTFRRPGKVRQFKKGTVVVRKKGVAGSQGKANQSRVKASREILNSVHYDACVGIDHKVHAWLACRSLECPLKRGTYLMPIAFLDETYEMLDKAQRAYEKQADALEADFPRLQKQAEEDLAELHDPGVLENANRFRAGFSVERKMFDFSPPDEAKLSESVYKAERKKWADTFSQAEDEVKGALREACRDLVAHLAERLEPAANGKRKSFHHTTIDKILEFFELFDKRNILDDRELKNLVSRGKRILRGGDVLVDGLREDQGMRDIVREQMNGIKEQLDTLIKDAPRRRVSFDD